MKTLTQKKIQIALSKGAIFDGNGWVTTHREGCKIWRSEFNTLEEVLRNKPKRLHLIDVTSKKLHLLKDGETKIIFAKDSCSYLVAEKIENQIIRVERESHAEAAWLYRTLRYEGFTKE